MKLLGIDPGFAALGLALVDVRPTSEELLELAVIRTEKSKRKLAVRAAEDQHRRACELVAALDERIQRHGVVMLAVEAPSFGAGGNGSGAAFKTGIAWGIISTVAHLRGLAVVQASPQDIKRRLCDRKNASKEEVAAVIEARFPDVRWPVRKADLEHAADAAGVALTCLDAEIVRVARRLSARTEQFSEGAA